MSKASKTKSQPAPSQKLMPVELIDIKYIHVPGRLRVLKPDKVDAIASSMSHQGQLNPINVRSTKSEDYELVAWAHRLKAAEKLGWERISATRFLGMSDDDAALAEIDENLCRAELEPAELANHIGRRKAIYEKLHPETKQGAAPGQAGGGKKAKGVKNTSFAKATAKATGQSKSTIDKAAKRAKVLGKLLDRVNGTCLDKSVELDALCKLSEAEQEDLVARAAAGEKVSAKEALAAKKNKPAPVTGSAERPIEGVKAAGAALAESRQPDHCADMSTPADEPIDEARKERVKACLDEATKAAEAARSALRGEPLPTTDAPSAITAMIERLMEMPDDQRLNVLCAVIKVSMKGKSLDAQYPWAEAINKAACLDAGGGSDEPAPKPTNGGNAEPPKAPRPLKWNKDDEAVARNAGRFAVMPQGIDVKGYEAEYTRPEWVGKAISTDEDDKLACVTLGTFHTKKAAKEACEAFNANLKSFDQLVSGK